MNDDFAKRVGSAAIAGWWTILIGSLFLTLQWLMSQMLLSAKPDWVLTLWGPGISWATVGTIWWWIMAIFKMTLWLMALLVIWLSLWARRLRS
ncbi:MAG TPA: hypothetical protein VFO18_17130 [Methylomirabilota bacterium]|nr:hypothetical protein [Methylomirabilota bacterium]